MEFTCEEGRIFANDEHGRLVAEITFPDLSDAAVNLNHTFVDRSLRGQGIADQLIRLAIDQVEERGLRIRLSCSYAKDWFNKHPEYAGLLCD